mmetsp:Transcript_56336/g.142493  ORF Transcript_56336/g.142493 Transcript_56336/m.142493 type:complete len:484 (+) Transcript_56336:55-1506(+)
MATVAPQAVKVPETHKSGDAKVVGDVLRKILPAAGGSFIEWYEFAIYSYLSSYITDNFFADGRGGSVGTWAGFAITFAFRPLGGAFFGFLADRFGRKPAMQLTILLMLVTTVLQGCLPSFSCCGDTWGWFGLVTLLVLRALQGLSAGGELSTAAVYISEISPRETLGFNLSWISVSGAFGAWTVAAIVVFIIESSLSKADMLAWGWRLPYLTSLAPGSLLIFFRQYLEETEDFEGLVKEAAAKKANGADREMEEGSSAGSEAAEMGTMQELLANHKLALLVGSLGTAGIGALWYVPPVYGVQFIQQSQKLPSNAVTFSEMLAFFIPTVLAMFVGMLVDSWGACKVHTLALSLGCIASPVPLFYWWAHVPPQQAILSVYMGQIILGFMLALTTSVYLWVVELFPVKVRVTGVSIAYNIGIGIFGGLGPVLSDLGNKEISPKGPVSAPAAFTLFAGALSLGAVASSHLLARRGLLRLTHIRDAPY